jgi:hypothetical protein
MLRVNVCHGDLFAGFVDLYESPFGQLENPCGLSENPVCCGEYHSNDDDLLAAVNTSEPWRARLTISKTQR